MQVKPTTLLNACRSRPVLPRPFAHARPVAMAASSQDADRNVKTIPAGEERQNAIADAIVRNAGEKLEKMPAQQAYERFGDPAIPLDEAAQRLMEAGQSNAVKGEVAGKDSLPTDGVKGSGVTADSMASAVQSVVDRSDRPNPPVAAQKAKARLEEEVQAARDVGGLGTGQ